MCVQQSLRSVLMGVHLSFLRNETFSVCPHTLKVFYTL